MKETLKLIPSHHTTLLKAFSTLVWTLPGMRHHSTPRVAARWIPTGKTPGGLRGLFCPPAVRKNVPPGTASRESRLSGRGSRGSRAPPAPGLPPPPTLRPRGTTVRSLSSPRSAPRQPISARLPAPASPARANQRTRRGPANRSAAVAEGGAARTPWAAPAPRPLTGRRRRLSPAALPAYSPGRPAPRPPPAPPAARAASGAAGGRRGGKRGGGRSGVSAERPRNKMAAGP